MKAIRLITTLIGLYLVSGCASMIHKGQQDKFNNVYVLGDYEQSAQIALDQAGYSAEDSSVDNMWWGLQSGFSLSYVNEFEQSNSILDIAESNMKIEDLENLGASIGESAGSFIGNDAMIDYEPSMHDATMLNVTKAWNYLALGDKNNSRVELNRAEERQRRAVDYFAGKIKQQKSELNADKNSQSLKKSVSSDQSRQRLVQAGIVSDQWKAYEGYVNPFVTYTYALNLLLYGNDASDYEKARNALQRVYSITGSKAVLEDLKLAKSLRQGASIPKGKTWVIVENGNSLIKREVRVDLPIFLLDGSVKYTGIALPKLEQRAGYTPNVHINRVPVEEISNMNAIIGSEFDKEFPSVLIRELIRATTKTIAQSEANKVDPMAGLLVAGFQLATTSADIRAVGTYPEKYEIAHLDDVKKHLELNLNGQFYDITLGDADHHLVYIKIINSQLKPNIRVIGIH